MKHLILAFLFLVGCTGSSPETKETPVPTPTITVLPSPEISPSPTAIPPQAVEIKPSELPRPIKGWPAEYDKHIAKEVMEFPKLLNLKSNDFCLKWGSLNKDQRVKFYQALMYAIVIPESGQNRRSVYWESTFDNKDSVTGLDKVFSEGLLQLSYQDMNSYKKGKCTFDWVKDRPAFMKDLKANQTKHSFIASEDRTILDPYINLSCGVQIINYHADHSLGFTYGLGRYWATMRPTHKSFKTVKEEFKKKFKLCE